MKKLIAIVLVVAVLAVSGGVALAKPFDNYKNVGHGALNGPHYNLNIIGVNDDHPKNDNMGCGNGHRIFVLLGEPKKNGNPPSTTRIWLNESDGDFYVEDCDGTDGHASFWLPDPAYDTGDPDTYGTAYSVFIRPLGNPNGYAEMQTCYIDTNYDPPQEVCMGYIIELDASKRPSKFVNVSRDLLTVCVWVWDPVKEEWTIERRYIFDPLFEDYLWKYDNWGAKLVQLRFYLTPTEYDAKDWNNCPGQTPPPEPPPPA